MKFFQGQRVRVIANHSTDPDGDRLIGHEGRLVRPLSFEISGMDRPGWIVDVPTMPGEETTWCAATEWGCWESELVPLQDPKAEAFIAEMKRFSARAEMLL